MKLDSGAAEALKTAIGAGLGLLRSEGITREQVLSGVAAAEPHETLKRFLASPQKHFSRAMVLIAEGVAKGLEGAPNSGDGRYKDAVEDLRSAVVAYIAAAGPMGFPAIGDAEAAHPKVSPFVWALDGENALSPFVTLSDGETDITTAHPGLLGERRRQLYRGWWERNPQCFLSGVEPNRQGHGIPVAVSIILPLTQEGFDKFLSGEAQTVNMEREPDLSDLTEFILPPGQSAKHILLDTWIIKPTGRKDGNAKRYRTRFYPTSILNYHLAQLTPDGMEDVKVIVEPDYDRIHELLQKLNAEDKKQSAYIVDFSRENVRTIKLIRSMESDVADWRRQIFGTGAHG